MGFPSPGDRRGISPLPKYVKDPRDNKRGVQGFWGSSVDVRGEAGLRGGKEDPQTGSGSEK